MYDQYNRKINYLRISVTDRCNLRCKYCMPPDGIRLKNRRDILSYEEIVKITKGAVNLGITKVRLTGGEPLVRKGIVDLVKKLKAIVGIEELCMTTNGVVLKEFANKLKEAGLDRLNISLDTINSKKYQEITRGGNLDKVLLGITEVIKVGFKKTKINMVIIPGFNSNEIEDLQSYCKEKNLILQRISRYSLSDITTINREYVFERPLDCSECNRIRLMSNGILKPCLFSDIEIPVDLNDVQGSIIRTLNSKPEKGCYNQSSENWQIGG